MTVNVSPDIFTPYFVLDVKREKGTTPVQPRCQVQDNIGGVQFLNQHALWRHYGSWNTNEMVKTHQADFWVSVRVSCLCSTGDSDRNPKFGLMCFHCQKFKNLENPQGCGSTLQCMKAESETWGPTWTVCFCCDCLTRNAFSNLIESSHMHPVLVPTKEIRDRVTGVFSPEIHWRPVFMIPLVVQSETCK